MNRREEKEAGGSRGGRIADSSAMVSALKALASRGLFNGGGVLPGLLVVALSIWLLQTAQPVLLPLTLGLLLAMLTWPAVRLVMRTRLPRTPSSALVVLVLVSATVGALYSLSGPASDWIRRAPGMLQTVEYKLHALKRPIEQIQQATEAVKEATRVEKPRSSKAMEVEVTAPGPLELMLEAAPASLLQMLITLVALFFFLAWGDGFMQRVAGLFQDDSLRHRADRLLENVRETVSRYLTTITLINIGLGTVVGLVLYVLDYPNPVLWAVSIALLNFAPFVGAMVALVGLTVVGLVSFDTLTPVIVAVLSFGVLTTVEGYFVTPAVLGRQLSLDPLAIFISLMVWGWLWGALGVLMAVPLLVCLRVIWQGVAELEDPSKQREGAGPGVTEDLSATTALPDANATQS